MPAGVARRGFDHPLVSSNAASTPQKHPAAKVALLKLHQLERDAVHAIAQPRRRRTVVKDMPQVESHRAQSTSSRSIPWLVSRATVTRSEASAWLKLGQPVPESNFVSESKSGFPQAAQTNVPCWWILKHVLEKRNARSPFGASRRTARASGFSATLHRINELFRSCGIASSLPDLRGGGRCFLPRRAEPGSANL